MHHAALFSFLLWKGSAAAADTSAAWQMLAAQKKM